MLLLPITIPYPTYAEIFPRDFSEKLVQPSPPPFLEKLWVGSLSRKSESATVNYNIANSDGVNNCSLFVRQIIGLRSDYICIHFGK